MHLRRSRFKLRLAPTPPSAFEYFLCQSREVRLNPLISLYLPPHYFYPSFSLFRSVFLDFFLGPPRAPSADGRARRLGGGWWQSTRRETGLGPAHPLKARGSVGQGPGVKNVAPSVRAPH